MTYLLCPSDPDDDRRGIGFNQTELEWLHPGYMYYWSKHDLIMGQDVWRGLTNELHIPGIIILKTESQSEISEPGIEIFLHV